MSMNPYYAAKAMRDLGRSVRLDVLKRLLQDQVPLLQYEVRARLDATTLAHVLAGQYLPGSSLHVPGTQKTRKSGSRLRRREPMRGLYTSVYTQGQYDGKAVLIAKLYGLAAMLYKGGRTAPHTIAPTGQSLAPHLRGRSAKAFGSGSAVLWGGRYQQPTVVPVNHPGSRIAPHPSILDVPLEAARKRALADLAKLVDVAIARAGLAA